MTFYWFASSVCPSFCAAILLTTYIFCVFYFVDRPGRAPGALRCSFVSTHAGILPEVSG